MRIALPLCRQALGPYDSSYAAAAGPSRFFPILHNPFDIAISFCRGTGSGNTAASCAAGMLPQGRTTSPLTASYTGEVYNNFQSIVTSSILVVVAARYYGF
jgi:hypothetical protein